MKKYEKPSFDLIQFSFCDVITSSITVGDKEDWDSEVGNESDIFGD